MNTCPCTCINCSGCLGYEDDELTLAEALGKSPWSALHRITVRPAEMRGFDLYLLNYYGGYIKME